MGWMQDSGLNEMVIAGCYHAGWFVHPHNASHRAYMTEGSVAYFHPDRRIFRASLIKPFVASFAKETNWLQMAGKLVERYKLRPVSWTIGSHNTRLAQKHPEYAQRNVYGDALPHALSIGHDAARNYLKALCRDLAVNYPMYGIQLESFGWMGLRHGHHHERDLTDLTPFEQELLAMCFNPQTASKAKASGIDVDKVRDVVRSTLEAAFREAPEPSKVDGRARGQSARVESLQPFSQALGRFAGNRNQAGSPAGSILQAFPPGRLSEGAGSRERRVCLRSLWQTSIGRAQDRSPRKVQNPCGLAGCLSLLCQARHGSARQPTTAA